MSSPILDLRDFSLDFVLDTDASGDGLSAVLSQMTIGEERVLAYASRALSRLERKYCATRWEMLGLVWAAHHFRPYLYGRKNRPSFSAMATQIQGGASCPLVRGIISLTTVVHHAGKRHTNANVLSHGRCSQCDWRKRKRRQPYPVMLYHTSCYQFGLNRRLKLNRVLTMT